MKISIISFGYSDSAKFVYNKMKESEVEIEYCIAIDQTKEKLTKAFDLTQKSDVVFCIGGLGYSQKDILKEFLAEKYRVDMVVQQKSCEFFANYINQSRQPVPSEDVQERLLFFPDGFDCYQSIFGYELAANGRFDGQEIFLLPDNLKETEYVFSAYIEKYLDRQLKNQVSFIYKVFGLSKSEIEQKLSSICKQQCIFYVDTDVADDSKILIKFDDNASQQIIDQINATILSEFDDVLYAVDDFSLNQVAVDLLKLYKRQLSVAESLTGGEIVSSIIDVPGASEVLFEGCTTYANGAKNKRLFVKKQTLEQFGAVSKETAYQMAVGLLETSQCDVVLATTGIAGPGGGTETKPVGLTFIAVGDQTGVHIHKYVFPGGREEVRQRATKTALFLLIKLIKLRK